MQNSSKTVEYISYLPSVGIFIFFILFVYSSTLYPGGSQADLNSIGYDWMNNYWCNLMNEFAMNEELNPARPVAITAMAVLCFSVMLFFIQFSEKATKSPLWKHIIKWGGIFSMICAVLMFSELHDLMTTLSSIFGVFAVIGVIWNVYQSGRTFFKWSGILCIILLALNNYIYYTEVLIEYLPIIQKFTFIAVLMWIAGLNISINRLKL